MEIQDSDINTDGDKTPEKNEVKDAIDGLPSDDEDLEDDDGSEDDGDKKPDDEDDGDKKPNKSEIAQKIKWRTKAQKLQIEIDELKGKPNPTAKDEKEIDDKEKQARDFIRKMIREETEALTKEQRETEERELDAFEEEVDTILEDNPDIKKGRLLDVIEEFEVEPKVALKIIKRWEEEGFTPNSKPKPKMPAPKRSSPNAPVKRPDDSGKSMYDVAREVAESLKNNTK